MAALLVVGAPTSVAHARRSVCVQLPRQHPQQRTTANLSFGLRPAYRPAASPRGARHPRLPTRRHHRLHFRPHTSRQHRRRQHQLQDRTAPGGSTSLLKLRLRTTVAPQSAPRPPRQTLRRPDTRR